MCDWGMDSISTDCYEGLVCVQLLRRTHLILDVCFSGCASGRELEQSVHKLTQGEWTG